jgi:hypothetical protein
MVGQLRNADVNLVILDLRLGQASICFGTYMRLFSTAALTRKFCACDANWSETQARFSALPSLRIKASKLEPNVLAAA